MKYISYAVLGMLFSYSWLTDLIITAVKIIIGHPPDNR